jgi:hypothetical protein
MRPPFITARTAMNSRSILAMQLPRHIMQLRTVLPHNSRAIQTMQQPMLPVSRPTHTTRHHMIVITRLMRHRQPLPHISNPRTARRSRGGTTRRRIGGRSRHRVVASSLGGSAAKRRGSDAGIPLQPSAGAGYCRCLPWPSYGLRSACLPRRQGIAVGSKTGVCPRRASTLVAGWPQERTRQPQAT